MNKNMTSQPVELKNGLTTEKDETLPGGAVIIKGKALRTTEDGWDEVLYRPYAAGEKEVEFKAVPYFIWGNREKGEMLVWIRLR